MSPRLLLVLVFLLSIPAHAASLPELAALQQQYAKNLTAPHEEAMAALEALFSAALANAVAKAKQAGRLDDVLALQQDQRRLSEKLPLPEDDDATPEAQKKLRSIYRDQLAKLEAQRHAAQTSLLPVYTARLKELEAALTRADRIGEALEVKTYRESLALADPAAVTPTTTPLAPPPIPPPAAGGKGDDRAAAELILSLGGKVMLKGNPEWLTTLESLPKGRFAVARIEFFKTDIMKRPLAATDADKLSHLEEANVFYAKGTIQDDETLRFLSTWPKLTNVGVNDCGWLTGTWLQHVAPLKNITTLAVVEAAKADTTALVHFQSSGITFIQFRNIAADDQTLAALSRFKSLRDVRLRKTRITDAGMSHLAGLKGIEAVDVSETPVSLAGLKSLAGSQLKDLGFGKSPEDMAAAAPELAVLFPKVESFTYPTGGITNASHLAALGKAWPKLNRLNFPSYHEFEPDAFLSAGPLFPSVEYLYLWKTKINDSHIPGIAQMKKLITLDLVDSQITDVALAELGKMKSLKKLYLSGTKVTDAALDIFRKARRDVTVTK